MADVVEWARFVLATVFLLAGVAKLGDRRAFAEAVQGYQLVPPKAAGLIAKWLPPLEIAAAVLLLAGLTTALTSAVAAVLALVLVVFSGAVAINLARGRRIRCGCFGATVERELTWWTVARNAALVVLAVLVTAGATTPGDALPMLIAGSLTVITGLLAAAALNVSGSIRRIGGPNA